MSSSDEARSIPSNPRYPEIDELFEIRKSTDKKSQDAKCRGCGVIRLKVKLERLLIHAMKCEVLQKDYRDTAEAFVARDEAYKKAAAAKSEGTGNKGDISKLKAEADRSLVQLICMNSLPISIVQSKGLKRLLQVLNPAYSLPTRKKVTYEILPELSAKCFNTAMKKLEQAEDYSIVVEIDGWTGSAGNSILAIVLTGADGFSVVLDLIDITSSQHSADLISELVLSALRTSNLKPIKFSAIISDEASNCRLARSNIVAAFPKDHLIEHRCMAHVFNLIGALMSRCGPVREHLEDVLKIVNVIGRSKVLSAELKVRGARKLVNTVPTRWYSIAGTINSLLNAREYLDEIPKTEEFSYSKWGPIAGQDDFWATLEDCKVLFDRLAAMIGRAELRVSSLSDSFRDLLEFAFFIQRTPNIRFSEVAIRAVVYHFNKLDLGLLIAAYMVNPNHRVQYLSENAINMGQERLVKTLFESRYAEHDAIAMMEQFERYQAGRAAEKIEDVGDWWKKSRMPMLSTIARRLLGLRASSANTERIFSALTNIATPKRSNLSCSTMYDLICVNIHENNEIKSSKLPASVSSQGNTTVSSQAREKSGAETLPFLEESPGTFLFDPALLEEAGTPHLSTDFYQSPDYLRYSDLINFNCPEESFDDEPMETEERRESGELARDFMSRYKK